MTPLIYIQLCNTTANLAPCQTCRGGLWSEYGLSYALEHDHSEKNHTPTVAEASKNVLKFHCVSLLHKVLQGFSTWFLKHVRKLPVTTN